MQTIVFYGQDADVSCANDPDGKKDGNPQLYTMSPDGSNITLLVGPLSNQPHPAWLE